MTTMSLTWFTGDDDVAAELEYEFDPGDPGVGTSDSIIIASLTLADGTVVDLTREQEDRLAFIAEDHMRAELRDYY